MYLTEKQIFETLKGSASALSLLSPEVKIEINHILSLANNINPQTISKFLIEGPSWRERLLAISFAFATDPKPFHSNFIKALHKTGGLSIIPLCAAITTMVNCYNCSLEYIDYKSLDRNYFDGEMGFALDKMLYHIRLSDKVVEGKGPNSGQSFEDHYDFYKKIGRV